MTGSETELDLLHDPLEHLQASSFDREDQSVPVDQEDGDGLFLDGESDLVDDPCDPSSLVPEQSVGAVDLFLCACVSVSQEVGRERKTFRADQISWMRFSSEVLSTRNDGPGYSRIRSGRER